MGPGSSPLARGLPRCRPWSHGSRRIIPARAGFTGLLVPIVRAAGDHPRSRGVYLLLEGSYACSYGSSPLARGLHTIPVHLEIGRGIIPARAGFTSPIPWPSPRITDHPRSRGVYSPRRVALASSRGSSPLARGLPFRVTQFPGHSGIIPARAGFTSTSKGRPALSADHPRSRGVYEMNFSVVTLMDGSSPLARGLRLLRTAGHNETRIIPARAGFTDTAVFNRAKQ